MDIMNQRSIFQEGLHEKFVLCADGYDLDQQKAETRVF